MRIEQVVTMPTPAPRGGGAAITGEQRQVQYVRGAYAWNETQPAGGGAPTFQSQPAASAERVLWLWAATPQGALKAAGATLAKPVADGAQINKLNQVDRVRAWMPNDVFGDMLVETTYSGYRNINGIPFPSRIVQSQGGYPTLDLTVTAVQINPFVDITVPDAVRNAPPPAAVTAASEKVADGVYWITGGSHHSLAVDMGDHVVIIEAPQNEARSDAVIAETKKLMANKPIRMVINTHLHFDHSGGLRRYVAEDATIVTHAANQAFYEKAWAGPRIARSSGGSTTRDRGRRSRAASGSARCTTARCRTRARQRRSKNRRSRTRTRRCPPAARSAPRRSRCPDCARPRTVPGRCHRTGASRPARPFQPRPTSRRP